MTRPFWTLDRIAYVMARRADGWSMSEIGRALKISRNAVCGAVHRHMIRMGVRVPVPRKSSDRRRKVRLVPKVAALAIAEPVEEAQPIVPPPRFVMVPDGTACSIVEVTGCRWPVGEDATVPGRYLFCNAAQVDGSAWCAEHRRQSVDRSDSGRRLRKDASRVPGAAKMEGVTG